MIKQTVPNRWHLEEFALAHTHSKNRTGKYLITLMLDNIKASEIKDVSLKNHIETKTYLNSKNLVSMVANFFRDSCNMIFTCHQTPVATQIVVVGEKQNSSSTK